MKTNSKQHPVFTYLTEQLPTAEEIQLEYDTTVEDTIQARLKFVVDTFEREHCYPENVKRYGSRTNIFANTLPGLPSWYSIEYRNHAILELAKQWGSLSENPTEREEEKILANWYNFAANKFAQLCKFNKVAFN